VSLVAVLAAWLGPGLRGDEGYDAAQVRKFRIFGNLFTLMMLFAVTTNNVGFMWIAIEATTITSAMLIPLHITKASVEASWKYILIGSVGIALAFGGTVLGYFDFVSLVGRQGDALNWTVLMASASRLHPQIIQLAFVFILIGYGTKAGLAPMHTWLPDAHSEAPAPLSAMMSGVLLAVALYAIMRWEAVVNVAVGTRFTDDLFIAMGLLSLTIGSFSLVIQRNYKRMLAYSSIEHIGLIAVGLALGPLGTFAAMLHLLNHALAKSTTFLLAGRVLHRYHTTEIGRVSGLLQVMPWTGGLFALGVLAVIGLPPFGLFMSEFALFRAGFAAGRPWLMGLVLALLTVAFVSMIGHLNRMLYGAPTEGVTVGERRPWSLIPLGLCVAALVVLGLTLPRPVDELLTRIMEIGTP
jgi:hydrogenase-4 component F